MESMLDTDVITIMERTLNYIDKRLLNHGRRVAAAVYQLLQPTGRYAPREIRDICIAALLHDIGAYKTEEIDKMVSFETEDTWEHSIYGYLFFKHFSPLAHLAMPILYHHTACTELDPADPQATLAQVLSIADRLDVYYQSGIAEEKTLLEILERQRGGMFFGHIVDLVVNSGIPLPVTDEDVMGDDSEINQVLHGIPLTYDEIVSYLRMIVLFIDFRSHQTLTHTIATASISDSLAELLGVSAHTRQLLAAGSWLHDIGKTGIPLHILEKPGKLTPDEMSVVQRHVSLTDEILQGCVMDEVRHIAAHHHEKLDGSGYPNGLSGGELPICERITVVADIFSALCGVRSYKDSFPKDRVISILDQMKEEGLVDPVVVDVCTRHYDAIVRNAEAAAQPFAATFENINREFEELQEQRVEQPEPV